MIFSMQLIKQRKISSPLISGKPRLVKYYNLANTMYGIFTTPFPFVHLAIFHRPHVGTYTPFVPWIRHGLGFNHPNGLYT